MEGEPFPVCWTPRASRGLPSLSLLSGPASNHPALTAALGPAVFNGKDSPKHQLLVKNRLSAVPRPSALGNLDRPIRGGGALLCSGPRRWRVGDARATAPGPLSLLELE